MNRSQHASGEGFRRLAASARGSTDSAGEPVDLRQPPWKAPYPIRTEHDYRRYLWDQLQGGRISREQLAATDQRQLIHDEQTYPDVIRKAAAWAKEQTTRAARPTRPPRFPTCGRR